MTVKLAILSNMAHYRRDGRVVGWGPAVLEIDQLATLFDSVHHVACLHDGVAPASALPYSSDRVTVTGVPPAGGESLRDKLRVLQRTPGYVRAMWSALDDADCVHVRCPANASLVAILLLALRRSPRLRWVKYAGNWRPRDDEPWSYTLQRWWLGRNLHRGLVTVNGRWPDQPSHVHSFSNPCLTEADLREGASAGGVKSLTSPIRMLYVGRVEEAKGCGRAIDVLRRLESRGIAAHLDVVGDGLERNGFERDANSAGLSGRVRFTGWMPRTELGRLYAEAHFLLLPSRCSEGWPKVLSEAMAYGVVPVTSDVSSIPQYLEKFRTGRALAPLDVDAYASAISSYKDHPERWKAESRNAIEAAKLFSYERYLAAVRNLLDLEAT